MNAIEIKNLSKRYGRFYAIKNINLNIREGQIFGLLGPNGAGKSTIMKVLSTLLLPTKGEVEIMGMNIIKNKKKIRNIISLVSDYTVLEDDLTSLENLKMFAKISNVKYSKDIINELIEDFGLSIYKGKLVKHLSSGNKQKLNIARAFLKKPKILLLDEPTNAIDVETSRFIREYVIKENMKEKVTVIICSHYIWEVEQLASDVGVIIDGRIKLIEKTENLYDAFKNIIKIYELSFDQEKFDLVNKNIKEDKNVVSIKPISYKKIIVEYNSDYITKLDDVNYRELTPSLEDIYSYVVKNKEEEFDKEYIIKS